jgi:type IV pilus assembly protein PilC
MTAAQKTRVYIWHGRDRQGLWVKGETPAASQAALRHTLMQQRIRLSLCHPKLPTWAMRQRVRANDVTHCCRQLATLLQAGLPLLQSLRLMQQGLREGPLLTVLIKVANDIESGLALSHALAKHPAFDDLLCHLVAAGEASGQLDHILIRLADQREKAQALQRAMRSAMVYPCAVLLVGGVVTVLLLSHVVPAFEAIFASTGAQLPALTRAVLSAGRQWQQHGDIFVLGVGGLVAVARHGLKSNQLCRQAWERLCLRLPLWGALMRQSLSARWCRTLATLLAAGLPIHDALSWVGQAMGASLYRDACEQIRQQLVQGQALSSTLAQHPALFDTLLVQMCLVGEESGMLDDMLACMAHQYEQRVDSTVAQLASLLEPAIMLVLGLLMGTLVLAMYWPIFQLGQVL